MKSIDVINDRAQFTVKVYTLNDFNREFNLSDLKIGDFVSEEVIDYLRNALSPITDWGYLFQSGGAICDRIVDSTLCPAFATFATSQDLPYWEYRGSCLKGEQRERGEVPVWQQ